MAIEAVQALRMGKIPGAVTPSWEGMKPECFFDEIHLGPIAQKPGTEPDTEEYQRSVRFFNGVLRLLAEVTMLGVRNTRVKNGIYWVVNTICYLPTCKDDTHDVHRLMARVKAQKMGIDIEQHERILVEVMPRQETYRMSKIMCEIVARHNKAESAQDIRDRQDIRDLAEVKSSIE